MRFFELGNVRVSRLGLSQLALAVAFSGACGSAGDDEGAGSKLVGTGGAIGTGGVAAPPASTGGKGAAGATVGGTGGKGPAGAGGSGGRVAVPTVTGGAGGATVVTDGGTMDPPGMSCLDGIENFDSDGPFTYMQMSLGSVAVWVPAVPAGCRVPIIHLANGTGGSCSSYQGVHERLASHGFLATCYESGQTGAGDQGIEAIEAAIAMFPDLVDKKIGSTGHSQGGQASFVVLQYAEEKWGPDYIYTGLAMEPASGFGSQPTTGTWSQVYAKIKSPMLVFSGTADGLVPQAWAQDGFDALDDSVEAYHYSGIGATHVPTPVSHTQQISIPWFRWKLLGDKKACMAFKALADGDMWDLVDEQNPKGCE